MARRDQLERQRQELRAILLGKRRGSRLADPAEDGDEFGQIVGADKAELLEEFVIGRQVGEHFDHGFGHLLAGRDQIFGQADLVENLQHVSIVGERFEIENGPDRRAEQQVLRDRGIGVEPLGIVGLDQVGNPVLDEPAGERLARLEQLRRPPRDEPPDPSASAGRKSRPPRRGRDGPAPR